MDDESVIDMHKIVLKKKTKEQKKESNDE